MIDIALEYCIFFFSLEMWQSLKRPSPICGHRRTKQLRSHSRYRGISTINCEPHRLVHSVRNCDRTQKHRYFLLRDSFVRTKRSKTITMSAVLIDTSCFIHEIPLSIYQVVCSQMDQNNRWQQLAREFGYDNSVIEQIKQLTSPATKLLSLCSDKNHTVNELFLALFRMKEYRLMEHLRDFVDNNYHQLIPARRSSTECKSSSFSSLKAQINALRTLYKPLMKSNSLSKSKPSSLSKSEGFKPDVSPFDIVCVGIPKIGVNELSQATNDWQVERVLGSGAFGTVYRGTWKCTEVAIKRINCQGYDKNATVKKRLKQILIEMRFLNAHRHDNILPLYGYSFDGSSACLVYQMMACGSLDMRLQQKKSPLTHNQRLNIAIGTARGLQFLHTFHKRGTVHGDIKSANILLDSNLQPKIGDFGLASQTNGHTKSKRLYGTHAYLADDFISSLIISTKNDVWAFGVILFELATSLRAFDERRGNKSKLTRYMWTFSESPERLNDLIDGHARRTSKTAQSVLMQLMQIGFSCTRPQSVDRPEMSNILNSLSKIS